MMLPFRGLTGTALLEKIEAQLDPKTA